MEELPGRDGTWIFEVDCLRIVPGAGANKLRLALGELVVPLEAMAGVVYEPGRKGGRLRLRPRSGADPLDQVTTGRLSEAADPYLLAVDSSRSATAEFFAEMVRNALLVAQVTDTPTDRYLLPGPRVPVTATAGDGTAAFDGERVRLEWNWLAAERKTEAGTQTFALRDLVGVEWNRQSGMSYGYLRFQLAGREKKSKPPEKDRTCLSWGVQRDGGTSALVAAAVAARLPHPSATVSAPADEPAPTSSDDPDALLRRLRELGELHRGGVLTDEEFTSAKQALLGRS